MPTQIIMPQLGESVVEGTVQKWLIQEGGRVKEHEPLLAITTDKVDTEIPAPVSGVLLKIHIAEGTTVSKGTLLAEIGDEESGIGSPTGRLRTLESGLHLEPLSGGQQAPATPVAQRMAAANSLDLAVVIGTGPSGRITREDVETHLVGQQRVASAPSHAGARTLGFISPVVARLADALDVDLTRVSGTGQGGRITKQDVLAFAAAAAPGEPLISPEASLPVTESLIPGHPVATDDQIVSLSPMRQAIAKHMVLSKQTSPHVTTVMEADMTRVVRAREGLRGEFERQGVRLTFTPFFVQAIVAGIQDVPEANSSFRADALLLHRRMHIGVAVALTEGLIVPVIRDADEKSLLELARAINDLAERARAKRLAPEEVQGGTFTLTNHGTSGSLFATPIIFQPQAGILGIGAIQKRAIVVSRGHPLLPDPEDAIAIRPMVYLSFTFDHRVLDGGGGDRFLAAAKRFLESYSV
jgi:2-oxoisovalerate dehydrogenase E2 component (dihydrolipoyl transacylase)